MDDVIIKIDNVTKDFSLPSEKLTSLKSRAVHPFRRIHYKKQHALKNINLQIKQGEFFGIVGRNGSGKSTLLKLLAGIYQPTIGNILVRGKLVPFIELGVGFNPELSGRENVFLNGALLGFSEKEIAMMYDDIVDFAELGEFMEQKLKNYSSGMQVRLAFSMAIRAKADILLIDEVLAVGDADFQRKCFEYFKQLKEKNTTVVFVTHDMGAVREFCDRAILVEESVIKQAGDPDQIAKEYTKLFNYPSQPVQNSPLAQRWGDRKANFEHVSTKLIDKDSKIQVATSVKADVDIKDPVYGFKISNQAKQSILGTNTKIENVKAPSLKKGQTVNFEWEIPNIFNEGKYFVELVLLHNSLSETADWWEDATVFSIINEKKTPYITNPPVKFAYRK